ncbi:MAG: VCBS repeat-containing protein, partial [Myxococcales bacterium]|nr:VCBS repeat-containing protein [Myxococcales bacterium]
MHPLLVRAGLSTAAAALVLATAAPASAIETWTHNFAQSWASHYVRATGDVNGDGFADLAVVEGHCCVLRIDVIYGAADPQEITVADLEAEIGGFIIDGFSSTQVAAADVNGDGINDLIIEASSSGLEGVGEEVAAHVIFGGPDLHGLLFFEGDPATFAGFTISRSASDLIVVGGGDVNGDGL